MIRVTKLSGKFYGFRFDQYDESIVNEQFEEIESLTLDGNPVIIVNDLKDLDEINIDSNSVIMAN